MIQYKKNNQLLELFLTFDDVSSGTTTLFQINENISSIWLNLLNVLYTNNWMIENIYNDMIQRLKPKLESLCSYDNRARLTIR